MRATPSYSSESILHEAKKAATMQAMFRPESAIILGIAILMTGLCLLNIFWFPQSWWLWLLIGIAGFATYVYVTSRDRQFVQSIAAQLFYARLDKEKLYLPELKSSVSDALEYHRLLFQEIVRRPYAPLGGVAVDVDRLIVDVYQLAHSLDDFVTNDPIKNYLLNILQHQKTAPTAPVHTLDEYTNALVTLKLEEGETTVTPEEAAILAQVHTTVADARNQLQDAIKIISAAHRRISLSNVGNITVPTDWSFVQVLRDSLSDHSSTLSEKTVVVNGLYGSCEVAAMQAFKNPKA